MSCCITKDEIKDQLRAYEADKNKQWFYTQMQLIVEKIPVNYIICNGKLKPYIPFYYPNIIYTHPAPSNKTIQSYLN